MGTETKYQSSTVDAPGDDRVIVYLGNRDAIEVIEDAADLAAANAEGRAVSKIRRPLPEGKRRTTIVVAPGTSLMDAAYQITHGAQGVWQAHSNADAPAWVASTDLALAQLLGSHWKCEVREPLHEGEPRVTAVDEEAGG